MSVSKQSFLEKTTKAVSVSGIHPSSQVLREHRSVVLNQPRHLSFQTVVVELCVAVNR